MEGTIKWFNSARGYGFIEPADGGGDVFFHVSALEPDMRVGNRARPGQPVAYEVVDGPRGPEAAGVGPIVASPGAPAC